MKQRVQLKVTVGFLLILLSTLTAQNQSVSPRRERPALTPVTVLFRDCDVLSVGAGPCKGDPEPDKIMSDSFDFNSRWPYRHGTGGVEAILDRQGSLILRTNKTGNPGAGRTLLLDFSDPVHCPNSEGNDSCGGPFLAGLLEDGTVLMVFDVESRDGGMRTIPRNGSVRAKLRLSFRTPDRHSGKKVLWSIRFSGDTKAGRKICGGKPSGKVQVTRTSSSTWKIEATSDATACVTRGLTEWRGHFSMPFQMRVSQIGRQRGGLRVGSS